jgi:hypothetical protein
MTDDPVAEAAAKANRRRLAITTTATLLQRRLDPRLIAADLAKLALARSIARVSKISITPKQRKRALITGGLAAATAIGMRVLYRNARENPSPPPEDDVKRLT